MKFTEQEMVFLHSITKGESVLGISLHFSAEEYENEKEKTIQSLIKKGVLESETELSRQGFLPAYALECYKNAKDHIIWNYMHVGILEGSDAVVIVTLKNREYEMFRIPRAALLYKVLEEYPILREAGKGISDGEEVWDLDFFLKQLGNYDGNIMIGKYRNHSAEREQVYFWQGKELYRYLFGSRIKSRMDAVSVRREMMDLLKIKVED